MFVQDIEKVGYSPSFLVLLLQSTNWDEGTEQLAKQGIEQLGKQGIEQLINYN